MEQKINNKPVGIILLAILMILSGLFTLLARFFMYQDMILYGNMDLHNFYMVYLPIIGILGFLIAYGLLKGRQWSWNAAIILMIITAILNVLNGSIGVVLNLIIITYLLTSNVTLYFGKKIQLKKNMMYGIVLIVILIVLFTIFISPSIPITKYKLLYPRIKFNDSNNNTIIVENIDYEHYYGSFSDLVWENIEIVISGANATPPSGTVDLGDTITLTDITENHVFYRVIWKPLNRVITSGYYWNNSD